LFLFSPHPSSQVCGVRNPRNAFAEVQNTPSSDLKLVDPNENSTRAQSGNPGS
jgi:hypothetical protein